jgi:hypothetical protein
MDQQPRPGVRAKKKLRDRLIGLAARHPEWVVGFEDETWWSRFEQPRLHAWTDGKPLRLVEHPPPADEPRKALACYGVVVHSAGEADRLWLRFVDGRPVSAVTIQFLAWCCTRLAEAGKRVWILVWDNAGWHTSQAVRRWIREHNRQVTESGQGVRIWACLLPLKSPWLNPIEPRWVHGKRRVVEPDRPLEAQELEERVYAALDCTPEEHLVLSDYVV